MNAVLVFYLYERHESFTNVKTLIYSKTHSKMDTEISNYLSDMGFITSAF